MAKRLYKAEDKKDKYIFDALLPYLLETIIALDSSDKRQMVSDVAKMMIFPYKTAEGIQLGSLSEEGVSWYFLPEGKYHGQMSRSSFRILDTSVMEKKWLDLFKHVYGQESGVGYITEFSENVVMNDIAYEMSKETSYTRQWWSYAKDLFDMWNKKDSLSFFSQATKNIESNARFFNSSYCPDEVKKELLQRGVYKDIIDTVSQELFFLKLDVKQENVNKFLEMLGVKSSFVDDEAIDKYLEGFLYKVGKFTFPVNQKSRYYKDCELSEKVIFEVLIKHHPHMVTELLKDDMELAAGIVFRNIRNEYVPGSWDLFYKEEDEKLDDEEQLTLSKLYKEYECCKFEVLHLNEDFYNHHFEGWDRIHCFDNVSEMQEDYNLGIYNDSKWELPFYVWLWSYTNNLYLIDTILSCLSNNYEESYIPKELNPFVLSIISKRTEDSEGGDYFFDILVSVKEAFLMSKMINYVHQKEMDLEIRVCTKDELTLFPYQRIKNMVMECLADNDTELYKKIERAEIWEHLYASKEPIDKKTYVCLNRKNGDHDYESIVILPEQDNLSSCVACMLQYISEMFDAHINENLLSSFDWEREYRSLVKGIRNFLSYKQEVRDPNSISWNTSDLQDVCDFEQEKIIWNKLLRDREKIIGAKGMDSPINLDIWRNFLDTKYHGRCQLCGSRTITGEDKAHFITFRMMTAGKSYLADMVSNMFCLCPTCHGELRYGYMGMDMQKIVDGAKWYVKSINEFIEDEDMALDNPPLLEELKAKEHIVREDEDGAIRTVFKNPICFDVTVNGAKRKMSFSWEHFMNLALIFDVMNDFEEEEDPDEIDYKLIGDSLNHYTGGNQNPERKQGTEWVRGHVRVRNGRSEWVSAHYRIR